MTIYNQPNLTSGIDEALTSTIAEVPEFTPMLLIFVFCVVLIGGMTSQKRRTGYSDMPMWAVIASLATLMVALPMTLTSGFISLGTLGVVVAITIASGVWLFLDKNRNEV